MERLQHHACFDGWQDEYRHESTVLNCSMNFTVFLPKLSQERRLPVLYWLSGLTCNEQNFTTKAGAQRYAAEHGLILVVPDTSPRGENVADDPSYDLGKGAGFYVNATQEPWASHYHMYDYVVSELPALIEAELPASDGRSISGHSMGGHGALVAALSNPGRYRSVSAFSPIVAPTQVPWGEKAFSAYLGPDRSAWKKYDACELIATAKEKLPLLIEQGGSDEFLGQQLTPSSLQAICEKTGHPLALRIRSGFDHSYYFISTFIADHIAYHANALHR
ncbi:S-formylglutathione hydrolase [Paraburkholderia sediminicola]|jgi:S-formylglutathione hydrolase|uniref:S-formylglutathione hydrolase n=1 Tax=Paraburkholderia sediminicola TaxID=458836 RepID=UPI0038BB0AE6